MSPGDGPVEAPPEAVDRAAWLIERLLVDRIFRAEFRRDPIKACRDLELFDLADELNAYGRALHTLELRESRSSLAGVVLAAAAEGIGVVEFAHYVHGGSGPTGNAQVAASTALSRHSLQAIPAVQADDVKAVPAAPAPDADQAPPARPFVEGADDKAAPHHRVAAQHVRPQSVVPEQSPQPSAATPEPQAAAPEPQAAAQPQASAAQVGQAPQAAPEPQAPPEPQAAAPQAPPEPQAGGGNGAASGADQGQAGSQGGGQALRSVEDPPAAGNGQAAAAANTTKALQDAPAGAPADGNGAAAPAPAAADPFAPINEPQAALPPSDGPSLAVNPNLGATDAAVTALTNGTLDPRANKILLQVLATHEVTIDVQPAPDGATQMLVIDSVDGEKVSPDSIAPRDIVGQLATLGPDERPPRIVTPWKITSDGFATDPQHPDRIVLDFSKQPDPPPAAPPPDPTVAKDPQPAPVQKHPEPASHGPSVADAADAVPGAAAAPQGVTIGAAAVELSKRFMGTPYHWGGANPDTGFDCSGLMQWTYHQLGVDIPRVTYDQVNSGVLVPKDQLQPGDLILFANHGDVHHVGMYIGNGQFIHAPHTGDVIKISNLSDPYYTEQYYQARRVATGVVPTGILTPAEMEDAAKMLAGEPTAAPVTGAAALPAPGGVAPLEPLQPTAPAAPPPPPSQGRASGVFQAVQLPQEPKSPASSTLANFPAVQQPAAPGTPGVAPVDPTAAPAGGGAAGAVVGAIDPNAPNPYPGDDAPKAAIAQWMGREAQKRGLPRELPVMASLVESTLTNVQGGDRDSVGYFQMRTGIWNQGDYAGYPSDPSLQVKWFLDRAVEVKQSRIAAGNTAFETDPNQWGEWIADVERPAEQYRGRYQEHLEEAKALFAGEPPQAPGSPAAGAAGVVPTPSGGSGAAGAADAAAGALPAPNLPAGTPTIGSAAVELSKRYMGTAYQWGGASPETGFDCSGLMQWTYHQLGVDIPRVTYDQVNSGVLVPKDQLQPGDLILFANHGDVHHVGMYIGNGQFIHAPHTGDVIKISNLSDPYYTEQYYQARRVATGAVPAGILSAPEVQDALKMDAGAGVGGAAPGAQQVLDAPGAAAPGVVVDPSGAAAGPAAADPVKPSAGRASGVFRAVQLPQEKLTDRAPTGSTVQFLPAVPDPANQPVPPTAPLVDPTAAPGTPATPAAPTDPPAGPSPVDVAPLPIDPSNPYPGDNAPKAAVAAWMAGVAEKNGLPRELPIMAGLVESGLTNVQGGDRDSVGFFQMRTGIWNQGDYAGYPDHPELQLKWFIDNALAVKADRLKNGNTSFQTDPNQWGEWIADVERPAEQYRGRYQERLDEARGLLQQALSQSAPASGSQAPSA